METIATIGWLLLLSLMIFMSIYIIVKTIKTERNRKIFIPTMKPGDKVTVPVMDRYIGEVLEVGDDEVKIVVTAPKSRVYPKK
jgi:preprotein translocase subunit YajC